MGAFSRNKGQRGEREIVSLIKDLTGWDVSRRVRQHDGDSDIEGVPGWSVEVKNCATLKLNEWWDQTVEQAIGTQTAPVLFYKVPRKGWNAMWPISVLIGAEIWLDRKWSVTSTVEAWATVAVNLHMDDVDDSMEYKKHLEKHGLRAN